MDQALVNHYAQIFGWTQTDKDVLLSDSKIREQVIRFINNNQLHHSSSVREALKVHLELLRTNPDYRSLNIITGTWPDWMWDIAGDVLVEMAQAILKKNLPGVNLPGNVIAAIKSCGTGDLLSCIGNTIDVLKEFFPALRAIDLAIDTAENVVKATKVWKALEKLQGFGEEFVSKVIGLISAKGGNLLDSINWENQTTGIKLYNVGGADSFRDDFKALFPDIKGPFPNPTQPLEQNYKVQNDLISISFYPISDTTGGPTITMKVGNCVIKFRLDP